MKRVHLLSLIAAATIATGTFAQTTWAQASHSTTPGLAPQVLTDAAPLPPEERSSTGAILIETQPVPAQRAAFQRITARNDAVATQLAQSVKEQVEADRALAAREGAPDTTQMGAPPEPRSPHRSPKRGYQP